MKKVIIINLLIAFTFLISACDEALEEVKPRQQLEESFFTNEQSMQRAVSAAYAGLANIYGAQLNGNTLHGVYMLPADDITFDGTGSVYETFNGLNPADGRISALWDRFYVIISRANFVIDKLQEPDIQSLYTTEGLIAINEGEMRFLRAWCHIKLWDWFRKAPAAMDRPTTLEAAVRMPTQGLELLNIAIEDLKVAATLLPNADFWDIDNVGRVFDESAYGLLVKAYVLRANYDGGNTADYNLALESFSKINTRVLVTDFGQNFDYRYENNSESLFEFQASFAPISENPWLSNDFGGGVGQMGAFYQYYTNHWGNYSSGIFGPTAKLINAFDEEDPRMEETLSNNPDDLDGTLWFINPNWSRFNGYHMVKYVKGERGNKYDPGWSVQSANNPRLLRYADVMLMAAEAHLQTGNAGEALVLVNKIRERARNSSPVASVTPADLGSVTIDDIMNERFLELAGEDDIRWTDLRRWHAAGFINLGNWTATDFGYPFEPSGFKFNVNTHLLFPIPNNELERNPHMSQSGNNPNYQ